MLLHCLIQVPPTVPVYFDGAIWLKNRIVRAIINLFKQSDKQPNGIDNEQPIGASEATLYGVSGTIRDESNPNNRLLNEKSEYTNAYILVVGKTYTLEVSPRLSDGSRPIGLTATGVTLLYDKYVFVIEVINENKCAYKRYTAQILFDREKAMSIWLNCYKFKQLI